MKKIFAAIVCLVIFCNFSVTQAKQVRLADEGTESLYQNISKFLTAEIKNLSIGELQRTVNNDEQMDEEVLRAWSFPVENHEGLLARYVLLANSEGYVAMISIFIQNQTVTVHDYSRLIGALFYSSGLPVEESSTLFKGLERYKDDVRTSRIWSYKKNKYFNFMEITWDTCLAYILYAE